MSPNIITPSKDMFLNATVSTPSRRSKRVRMRDSYTALVASLGMYTF